MDEIVDFVFEHGEYIPNPSPDGLRAEFEWLKENALLIAYRDNKGITELGGYLATSVPKPNMEWVIAGDYLNHSDENGPYLYCVYHVRRPDISKPIPLSNLKNQWKAKYPNIKWLCYLRARDDFRLVKVPIHE